MWKWIGIAVALVVVLLLVVAIVGWLLPREHVASSTAVYRQPIDAVWKALVTIEEHPSWRHGLTKVEHLPPRDGRACYREHGSSGPLTFVVERDVPPRLRVGRIVDEAAFGGTWTFALEPEAGGTRLTITEDGWIANPIFRALARFAFGYHGTQVRYLEDLGGKFGERVGAVRVSAG
jgi:uncharacterized protein YndB with AHSA1/START domain